MAEGEKKRLDNACRCLDLPRPDRSERLGMEEEDYKELGRLMGSLSDPVRLKILDMLTKGPLYVCIIQFLLDDIKDSRLSYHLEILKKNGLIEDDRQGNFVLYKLTEFGHIISEDIFEFNIKLKN